MSKCIFLAGATGAIGRRLVPLLIKAGYRVVGTTRHEAKAPLLREMGAEPVVVDVYDGGLLCQIMAEIRPDVVIHQLTDLPYALDPDQMADALVRNARLRDEGTRNLVSAAMAAGVGRLIAQSIAFVYADGTPPYAEDHPLMPATHPVYGGTARAVACLERQVLEAPLQGIVLRYGLFYGPGTGFDAPIAPGSVHVDAAAKAAECAVTQGVPGIYNVAESDGTVMVAKAALGLGWDAGWRCPAE